MRAKLLLLNTDERGKMLCECADAVLGEIAVTFSHQFSIMREKIGEASRLDYGAAITEETVALAMRSNAILVGRAECEEMDIFLSALSVPHITRRFPLPGNGLCYIMKTTSLNEEVIRLAKAEAMKIASEEHLPIYHIEPTGKAKEIWNRVMQSDGERKKSISINTLNTQQAMEMLVHNVHSMGILLAPPYAGNFFTTLATTLHKAPMLLYDASSNNKTHILAPVVMDATSTHDDINPLGMLASVAHMLRYALNLQQEADFVDSVVENCLSAGWYTKDMYVKNGKGPISGDQMFQLIMEQISMASELANLKGEL